MTALALRTAMGGDESLGVQGLRQAELLPPQSAPEACRIALRPVQAFSQATLREAFGPLCGD